MNLRQALSLGAVPLLPILVVAAVLMSADADRSRAAPLSGAIFTTTPDGTIVNENVHYDDKRDVYLDGGPPPNAPRTAAGVPDGDYVVQVTDPSGRVLLSEDASKCRVVRAQDGVIVALRDKNGSFSDHTITDGCHINDDPPHPTNPGVRGDTGKHDSNVDVDHGPPAIVVQLMPFFDTPNPGGVYKAWVTPLSSYLDKGGNLDSLPVKLCVNSRNGSLANNCNGNGKVQIGYQADPGFGPPRDQVKTDNFKVRETPFVPPTIKVRKFSDLNGDGVWQQDREPEIGRNGELGVPAGTICVELDGTVDEDCDTGGGWPYGFIEPTADGPIGSFPHFTPKMHLAAFPGEYVVEEAQLPGWNHTTPSRVVIEVTGTSGETHEVIFGNQPKPDGTCLDHQTGERLRWCLEEDVVKG